MPPTGTRPPGPPPATRQALPNKHQEEQRQYSPLPRKRSKISFKVKNKDVVKADDLKELPQAEMEEDDEEEDDSGEGRDRGTPIKGSSFRDAPLSKSKAGVILPELVRTDETFSLFIRDFFY